MQRQAVAQELSPRKVRHRLRDCLRYQKRCCNPTIKVSRFAPSLPLAPGTSWYSTRALLAGASA